MANVKKPRQALLPVLDIDGNELRNGNRVDMLDEDLEVIDTGIVTGVRPGVVAPPKIRESGLGHWVGLNRNRAHGIHLLRKHLDAIEPSPDATPA